MRSGPASSQPTDAEAGQASPDELTGSGWPGGFYSEPYAGADPAFAPSSSEKALAHRRRPAPSRALKQASERARSAASLRALLTARALEAASPSSVLEPELQPAPPPQSPLPGGGASAKRLAIGTVIMGICNAGKLAAQLLLIPLLAHFLGPADYGVYSLAMPSIFFVMTLADGGLGDSLAREDEKNELVWSSSFWLVMGLGAFLTALLSLWSVPLSMLAHQPALPLYMIPLSFAVMLMTLSVLPAARLIRRQRLGFYSMIDVAATILAAVAALSAAALHFGVWSLVIQVLITFGLRALVLNVVAFHVPRFTFSWAAVRSHFQVGSGIAMVKFSDSIGRMVETSVVSRRFGAAPLGSYGFANSVAWSLTQSVANPIWTAFYVKILHAKEDDDMEGNYHQLLRLSLILTLPVAVVFGVNAPVLIGAFLGHKWVGSAFLIALIFPTQALGTCGQLATGALYAKGKTRSQTLVAIFGAIARVAAVSVVFGGFTGLAYYIGLANLLYASMGLINARYSLGWRLTKTLKALRGPLLATAAAGLEAYVVATRLPPTFTWALVSCVIGGLIFLMTLAIFDRAWVKRDFGTIRQLIKR